MVTDVPDRAVYQAILQAGAGTLYQAVIGDQVLSSALVLKAARGAYYQSSGTSPDGMACGASHFLVCEIARTLRDEGMELFNLGGADPQNRGLWEFKSGFGAIPVPLESAGVWLGSTLTKKASTAVRLLRQDPLAFLRYLAGSCERFDLFAADTNRVPSPPAIEGTRFEKLSDETLCRLSQERSELRVHGERASRLGFNSAYGIFCGPHLAHISWLMLPQDDRRLPIRYVELKPAEAEITHCLTLPEFRGRGLYPYAIANLCRVARGYGAKRVFMTVPAGNVSSRRGVEKAGLISEGRIVRIMLPYLPGQPGLIWRGHRWRLAGMVARCQSGETSVDAGRPLAW
jgi:hypothetical protein